MNRQKLRILKIALYALLGIQVCLSLLSLGFSLAILIAFLLMLAAPVCFSRSMEAAGAAFLLVPSVVGVVAFQAVVFSPVFLLWFLMLAAASMFFWLRPGKPPFKVTGS